MPEDYDPETYLTPGQVARLWKVSPEAVRKAIREQRLPALRTPTGRYLVRKVDARLSSTGGNPDDTRADHGDK